jgi:glycine oxidase
MKQTVQIAIVGAGIVGLSIAYYLNAMGREVMLIEASEEAGKGASWMAAGMLAPVNEIEFQELALYQLGREALNCYYNDIFPQFSNIGQIESGAYELALTSDDAAYLKRSFDFQKSQGARVEWYNSQGLKSKLPYLGNSVVAGIFAPDDIQIDNRLFLQTLISYLLSKNVPILTKSRVVDWQICNEDLYTLHLENNEISQIKAQCLIFSNGYSELNKKILPEKIFPIRGQMLSLQSDFDLEYTLRIRSRSLGNGYIVPKVTRWVIGTTAEQKGNLQQLTAGGILDILQKAYAVLPMIYEFPILEMWSGLRPATASHSPLIGKYKNHNLYFVNGLYRHGILLGPYLGKVIAEAFVKGALTKEAAPFWKEPSL